MRDGRRAESYVVGVVGAGVMGRGVAHAVAAHGHKAVLVDVSASQLQQALEQISATLKAEAFLRGASATPPGVTLARISAGTEIDVLHDCDVVIENVVEKAEVKRAVYAALGSIVRSDAILAANTSTIPILEIASYVSHPERVIGMHFMNPAHSKPAVELIPGAGTSAATVTSAQAFLSAIGKHGIIVKDGPGFVSNRVLMMTINEAIRSVEEEVASAEDVDRIFVECFGHPMGPLATGDLIGLDTIIQSLESLRERFGDAKYEPTALLRQMVSEGRLGRKTSRGFFRYGP